MFVKVSEILEKFIEIETKSLQGVNMPHMPTLGSAYEAITKVGIDQEYIIPKHLGLKVVSGFISVNGNMLKAQIDAMLVVGEGQQYGRTEEYIYEIRQVLCVFEIKKTLTKKDLIDAFLHLRDIRNAFIDDFNYRVENEDYKPDISSAAQHFSQITGKVAPKNYQEFNYLSIEDHMLIYSLLQESLAPATIIQGYGGYKTEFGLRKAFIDSLEGMYNNSGSGAGLGVPNLPSLITSNEFSLVKGGGLPFVMANQDNNWVVIGSTRYNSVRMIMELIWTKISIYFGIAMPWGDGLTTENVSPLMLAIPEQRDSKGGWRYPTIEMPETELERSESVEWAPHHLGTNETRIFTSLMIFGGAVEINEKLGDSLGIPLEDLMVAIKKLVSTMEFVLDDNWLHPLNSQTLSINNADGTSYLSSNRDRFDAWCTKNGAGNNYIVLLYL